MNSQIKSSSRRNLLRRTGTLLAASLAAPIPSVAEDAGAEELDRLAKHVLEGPPVQMNEAQLQHLKREIASLRKTLARLRAIKLRNDDGPATVFRAR